MTVDLSKAGMVLSLVGLLSVGVGLASKWFGLTSAVASHGLSIEEMKAAYVKTDDEVDVLHETLIRVVTSQEHTHRDIYRLRKELRMSDRGQPLPPLGPEGEE